MKKIIKILDTTLRDGEQMAGVNLNIADKLRTALMLEKLGVDIIEAGFPSSSKNDFKAAEKIAAHIEKSTVSGLSRAVKEDIDIIWDAVKLAKKPLIHIFIASSDIHLKYKLKMTREQVYQRAVEAVKYAKTLCPLVEFSPEDASRSDRFFLCALLKGVIDAGADIINIPDTVGYSTPEEFGELIKHINDNVIIGGNTVLSAHCHNDLGLAAANTLSAIKNGASQVECTVNGIGERAGNASLEEIVMALTTRADYYGATHNINTTLLTKASKLVSTLTDTYVSPNKPIVGANVFSHEAGIHQHGMLENSGTYEIMTPQSVGFEKSLIILGKHSGHHAFKEKTTELGYHLDDAVISAAFAVFKDLCCRKKEVSDDDIRAIIEEAILDSNVIDGYDLESYQTQSGNKTKAMAMISLSKGDSPVCAADIGEGPIDASFNAINRIVGKEYTLVSYSIKAVTGGTDALGEVRVRISDGIGEYSGRGFSTDIIESSIKAYINAINRSTLSQ